MNKDYKWDFDLTNKQDNNLIFLAEQGVDIIKNPDGCFKFEKPCWIENNHFYSKYDCEHTWGIDADGNRFHNCDICSHNLSNHCCEVQAKIANLGKNTYPMSTAVIKCEAYDPIEEMNIIRNMDEMVTFINRTLNFLGGCDVCCGFYGFEIPSDEDGHITSTIEEYYKNGGKFTKIPEDNEYPVVIYFDYQSEYFDSLKWISIKNLVNQIDKFVCINDYYDDIDCASATFCMDKEYFGKIQPDGSLSVDSDDIEDVDEWFGGTHLLPDGVWQNFFERDK